MSEDSAKNAVELFRSALHFDRILDEFKPGGATREQLIARVKAIGRPLLKYRFVLERAKYGGTPILDWHAGNDYLSDSFGKPAAVGRFGASELGGMVHYLAHGGPHGHCPSWGRHRTMLYRNAGVYPPDPEILSRFCQVSLDALGQLDVLGVWFRSGENSVRKRFAPQAKLMELTALEPYYHSRPWSRQLAAKRVLVVSPFAETIKAQYRRREQVWRTKPDVLPEFHLRTVRVPLSAALIEPEYPDWFAALHAIQRQMAAEPFNVAIIGAGAWSLLLTTYAKSLGAWAIHLGGPTQILFGIKGRRWETSHELLPYFNEAWTRPSESETPRTVRQIENGCYW
jgi:hypothetical protein